MIELSNSSKVSSGFPNFVETAPSIEELMKSLGVTCLSKVQCAFDKVVDIRKIRAECPAFFSEKLRKDKKKDDYAKFVELLKKPVSSFDKVFEVRKISDKVGFGVFAKSIILTGELIGAYLGVIRSFDDPDYETIDPSYCLQFESQVFENYVIDAKPCGNFTRFINHAVAKKANLFAKEIYSQEDPLPYIVLVTGRDIQSGEQLTFDYGEDYQWGDALPSTF